jgi:hypothetical protein
MDSFFHISDSWFMKIAELINTEVVDKDDVLLGLEKIGSKSNYEIIVLEILPERIDFNKQLLVLSELLNQNGTLCMITPTSFLFSKRDRENRINLLNLFHLEGVISLKRGVFNTIAIPCCLLLLDKKKGSTWFTTATNIDELVSILNNRRDMTNIKRYVYHSDEIDPNNLMPEHYNGEIAKVNQTLDKYETKKLYEVAELFVGKNIPRDELVHGNGFQYIRPRDIANGRIIHSGIYIDNKQLARYAKYTLLSGDILVTKQFGMRKIAQVTDDDCPSIASNGFIVIRPSNIPEQYLYDYLTSPTGQTIFNKQLDSIETGTTIRNINLSDISDLRIPIFDDKTMLEMINIEKLDAASLNRLADNLHDRLSEFELRSMLISKLLELGWKTEEIKFDDKKEEILINHKFKYIPDLVLKHNNKTVAIIEIKMTHHQMIEARTRTIDIIKLCTDIPLVIITNLKKYDLYFVRKDELITSNTIPSMPYKKEVLNLLDISEVSK